MTNTAFTIFDPIHKVISFEGELGEQVRKIVDTPEFQRLRRIKQLGLTDLVFPSATHTRFLHSLGAAWVAHRICQAVGASDEDSHIATITLLLHDIGHGPFSHTFEMLLDKQVKHETWSKAIISAKLQPALGNEITGRVASLLGQSDPSWLQALVSSQLDADRIDYLLRDSHFCGTAYGSFDLDWLIRCTKKLGDNERERLGILSKGVGVVEHLLLARRSIYQNIYHHPKTQILERILRSFFQTAIHYLDDITQLELPLYDYLQIVRDHGTNIDNSDLFVQKALPFYLALTDDVVWRSLTRVHDADSHSVEAQHLKHLTDMIFSRRRLPEAIPLRRDIDSKEAAGVVDELKSALSLSQPEDSWKINLISESNTFRTYHSKDTDIPVLVGKKISRLSQESTVIEQLMDQPEPRLFIAVAPEFRGIPLTQQALTKLTE